VRKRPAGEEDAAEVPSGKRAAPDSAAVADENEAAILRPPHIPEVFAELGARLRRGHLVSFPTETVYGLGANGLDAKAVLGIFEAKGRPLSDPCILHVASAADAAPRLLDFSSDLERAVFCFLAASCWPGPLSIVGRAQPAIPPEVTASTGFVAVRCPDHDVARQLIAAAGVPLAAPSANRFGHISPTLPEHVLEDLGHVRGLRILDGGPCGVGIESTVLKLDVERERVIILRKGGVTKDRLEHLLAGAFADGTLQKNVHVEYTEKLAASAEALKSREAADPGEAQESPGLLLRHYSPSVPSTLLAAEATAIAAGEVIPCDVNRSVLVDFAGRMRPMHKHFLKTFDLCLHHDTSDAPGSVEEACARAFSVLRLAEAFAVSNGAELICIADFDAGRLGGYADALHDRMFRAASGRRAALCGGAEGPPRLTQVSGGVP